MIEGSNFGSVSVDGKVYDEDILILADGSIKKRKEHHTFTVSEFKYLAEQKPDVIIACLGHSDVVKVEEGVFEEAKKQGIELVTLSTPKATDKYNELVKEKKVAMAVHITC